MKIETLIYDKARKILPNQSEKTIFFVGITSTSYEIFFYSFIEKQWIQCYNLVQEKQADGIELKLIFKKIAKIIRESKKFEMQKYNLVTIKIDGSGIGLEVKYYGRDAKIYKIKQEWEKNNLYN